MKRPLIMDTRWVRPLDGVSSDKICMTCLISQARWAIGKPPNGYLSCSKCFLVTSPWGVENAESITELADSVEKEMGRSIFANGQLTDDGADRILHSIVFASGVSRMRSARSGA